VARQHVNEVNAYVDLGFLQASFTAMRTSYSLRGRPPMNTEASCRSIFFSLFLAVYLFRLELVRQSVSHRQRWWVFHMAGQDNVTCGLTS
jgi:hypothetical protein